VTLRSAARAVWAAVDTAAYAAPTLLLEAALIYTAWYFELL
jgi:hypothetical protein